MNEKGGKMEIKRRAQCLIKKGVDKQASDLYILPKDSGYMLSYRYHQDIEVEKIVNFLTGEKLILYFKYLSGMDISEKRKPQVGSTTINLKNQSVRIRLSSVGDYLDRETLVIRFLKESSEQTKFHYVFPYQWELLENNTKKPGLYLFSGPTGAGKSTTMNQLANRIYKERDKQIITIEDPVEIENKNFLQFQVNKKINMTYNSLIKVCLRHRPDVLIIGEIRDQETAKMVVRASLTGHMVFSTIHATDKESVSIRLEELGIPKIELEQCLRGIIYQEMIPLKENHLYGVLYDLSLRGVITNWQKTIQEAYEKKIISKETYLDNK